MYRIDALNITTRAQTIRVPLFLGKHFFSSSICDHTFGLSRSKDRKQGAAEIVEGSDNFLRDWWHDHLGEAELENAEYNM